MEIRIVWASRISPEERGCINREKRRDKKKTMGKVIYKILRNYFLKFQESKFHFWFTRPKFSFKLLKLMIIYLNLFFFVSFFVILSGLWSFVSFRKHLLRTLLRLEFIILGVFFLMRVRISSTGGEVYFTLFFLALAACEGALGLSLLVSIVRRQGNDYFRRMGSLRC